jgi:hypothetical protein
MQPALTRSDYYHKQSLTQSVHKTSQTSQQKLKIKHFKKFTPIFNFEKLLTPYGL